MNVFLITDEWLNNHLTRDSHTHSRFPTSSQPTKECYEWDICEGIVIDSHPDDGYTLYAKVFGERDYEYKEIRKVKYIYEIELIYLLLNERKLEPISEEQNQVK